MKKCLHCKKVLDGRSDKLYCDVHCKSAHQYLKTKKGEAGFYSKVDKQLKKNRSILKNYNKAGKAVVRASIMHGEGFDPNFFTHYWKNSKGDVYLFVYEFGFLKTHENNIEKYVLVIWQEYMEK